MLVVTNNINVQSVFNNNATADEIHAQPTWCWSLCVRAHPRMTGGGIWPDTSASTVWRRLRPLALNLFTRRPDSDGVPLGVGADEVAGVAERDRLEESSIWKAGTSTRRASTQTSRSAMDSARSTKERWVPCTMLPLSAILTLFT